MMDGTIYIDTIGHGITTSLKKAVLWSQVFEIPVQVIHKGRLIGTLRFAGIRNNFDEIYGVGYGEVLYLKEYGCVYINLPDNEEIEKFPLATVGV